MIVKENINFERGQDPKDAMQTGVIWKIKEYAKQLKAENEAILTEYNVELGTDGQYEIFTGNDYEDDETYISSMTSVHIADTLLELLDTL